MSTSATENGLYARRFLHKEGDRSPDGRTLEFGALYLRDEYIPVTIGIELRETESPIVGSASQLQRDGDGTVSILLHFPEESLIKSVNFDDDFDLGFFADRIEPGESQDILRKARLAAIYLIPKKFLPKMKNQDD